MYNEIMSTPKLIKCCGCGKQKKIRIEGYATPGEFIFDEKDIDGMPIFQCGSIKGCKFKIDPIDYMQNRENKNHVVNTVSADLDFSNWDFEKLPTKKIKRSVFKKAKNFLGM